MRADAHAVRFIRQLLPYLTAGVVLAACYTIYVLVSRRLENRRFEAAAAEAERQKAQRDIQQILGGGQLKILNFYAAPGAISRGQKALLCYGTVNASSVQLDPAVERMYPALSRCFEVAPAQDTRYTLVASDAQGHTLKQSFVLQVK